MRLLSTKQTVVGCLLVLLFVFLFHHREWRIAPAGPEGVSLSALLQDHLRPGVSLTTNTSLAAPSSATPISPFVSFAPHYDDEGSGPMSPTTAQFVDATSSVAQLQPLLTSESMPILPTTSIRRTLVVAKIMEEDTNWIQDELGDLMDGEGLLKTAIYVVDDPEAEFHPPMNKGHEAMVYLTYIIDHYDALPDIALFMHSHYGAWHNNDLLDLSSSAMVRHMNQMRVLRDGYVNLRCHWEPGCPDWLHPNPPEVDINKMEEQYVADAWPALFPDLPLPDLLSQPCCSQFAVSRAAILRNPRQRYLDLREWLIQTSIEDHDSGRLFEYAWQVLFNHGNPIYCPNPRVCYCEGYGVCFDSHDSFDAYFRVQRRLGWLQNQRKEWGMQWDRWQAHLSSPTTTIYDEDSNPIEPFEPELGKDLELDQLIQDADEEMTLRKHDALALGSDPLRRHFLVNMAIRQLHFAESQKYDWRFLEMPKDPPEETIEERD